MRYQTRLSGLGIFASVLSVLSCTGTEQTGSMSPAPVIDILVNTRVKQDIDILFVIDHSPSMSPKQRQIASVIDGFIRTIDTSGANYHIGIVNTDIGSQTAPNTAFQPGSVNVPGCGSYAGSDGALQRVACSNRDQSSWSATAKSACTSLCPSKLEPTKDAFLSKQDGVTNAIGNDIIGTFKCMAQLGDSGCGLESPLEALNRALDGHSPTNANFLRPNSVLAVLFVTDEDDCSVQMASRAQNNPNSTDCSKNGMSTYNCWKNDFRCLANNLKCNEPLTSVGAKTGCKENGNGYLESVDKYVNFLSNLRLPSKLVLAGIWTPTLLDNPTSDASKPGKLVVDYDPQVCTPGAGVTCSTEALNRGQGAKAACLNATDQNFFGQAQVRLSSFIRRFPAASRLEQSICEPQNYATLVNTFADRITTRAAQVCLPARPRYDATGAPMCTVGLVDATTPDVDPAVKFPVCSAACCRAFSDAGSPSAPTARAVPSDPTIVAACSADPDCYCVGPNSLSTASCTDSAGQDTAQAGVWISAAPHLMPAGKVTRFRCESAGP